MRSTVDIGIDLGTTNSVVAVMQDGKPVIVKNGVSEVTPSYVYVGSGGQVFTGETAKNHRESDTDNVVEGFKRHLGSGDTWLLPASGQRYTAVNLAGLLLRDLRLSVGEYLNEEPDAAVITVPAAFGEVEKHAVALAGREAGFVHITMIQEPVAAGLAYGWEKSNDIRPFLVYDFGGGTFDASLMQCVGGQLVVRSDSGEHTLGGRDLDQQVLDHIVLPKLEGRVDPTSATSARRRLLWACEDAKINLSRRHSATVALGGKLRSVTGQLMEDVVTIALAEYEPLVVPFVDRTIEIIRLLLREAGLTAKDLSAIVLVGGPSKTPVLRKRLQEQLQVSQETIYTKIDPMIVVAQGAALFAASIPKPIGPVHGGPTEAIQIRLEFERVTGLTVCPVGLAVQGSEVPDGTMVKVKRCDGLWSSGLIPLRKGKAMVQVALAQGQQSSFLVEMLGPSGSPLPLQPNEFSILQGISAAPPPLSRSVGVIVESATGVLEVATLAERASPTPLTVRHSFRTTRALGPGNPESDLNVIFVEGESQRPLRNRKIGEVTIRGKAINRPLPQGSEVEITLHIDPSKSPTAKVFIPYLGETFPIMIYIDVMEMISVQDMQYRLTTELQRLAILTEAGAETSSLEKSIPEIRDELVMAESGDRDSLSRAKQRLSSLESQADELDKKAGPSVALKTLEENQKMAEGIVGDYGDEGHKQRLALLKTGADNARATNNQHLAVNHADGFMRLAAEVYWGQPVPWVAHFQKLVSEGGFVDPSKATQLIAEGRRALDAGDVPVLRRVVIDLGNLSATTTIDPILARFGGLMKVQ